eukprot:scpid38466/ scgid34657/ 
MVAVITEQLKQMELMVVASSVKQPSNLSCSPITRSDGGPFGTLASTTEYSEVGGRPIGNGGMAAAVAVAAASPPLATSPAAPRYQFRSSSSYPSAPGLAHTRRQSAPPTAPRARSHVLWHPPGSSRVWMVKYRRKVASTLDPVDVKDAWSADSICWKPVCKFKSTKPKSLSADTSYGLPFSDSEVTTRRPKSQPCLLPHRNSFGKRSHDERDSPRPYLSFAKMKKSCSYSGLDSFDDDYVSFELQQQQDRNTMTTHSPPEWGADLDVDAIERD